MRWARLIAAVLVGCLAAPFVEATDHLTFEVTWRAAGTLSQELDPLRPGEAVSFKWTGAHSLW